ncbi:MAG: CapA family protein [Nannocystis sp.]|nr:CapA family protein [Nannocystis sp.]MBA3548188.1 CapA family protein [Nannocystis sp.]
MSFVLASAPASVSAASYGFDTSEAAFDAAYLKSPIAVTGRIVDATGSPIVGATITTVAFGDGSTNTGRSAVTSATGTFTIDGLVRRSLLLKVTRADWYTEIVPVDLQRPTGEAAADTGTITMTAQKIGRVRLIFVGDTMLGRRFTDADEDGNEGEAGDLIRPSSRAADAKKIVAFVRDTIATADYSIANLECAVTSDPATPHPTKSYTFFSHPETLAGLTHAGFDGVDLGNNHVFDYMGAGVLDTVNAVAGVELDWTGADMNETLARNTTIGATIGGVPLALQGFNTLRTDGSNLTKNLLVARDPDKAGALEATSANMTSFLADEAGTSFAVPMVHGGVEYSSYPANNMRGIFVSLVKQGAGLVVAHHTHTMHGVGLVDPGTGPRFVLMSLGNFIFDQSTFETTQSVIAVADVETIQGGGQQITRLQLVPVHVERYVPKLLSGAWLARAARQLGHLSSTLPKTPSGSAVADGLTGATVFQVGPRVLAFNSPSQFTVKDSAEPLKLPLTGGATGMVEFTRTGPVDALAAVKTGATAQAEFGRDILLYGDFEDSDVDDAFSEGTAWAQTDSRRLQNSVVRSGTGAAVLLRKSSNNDTVSMSNYRTIPIPGGAKLTIRGYVRGANAGTFKLTTRVYDDDGDTLSTVDRVTRSGGTYGWTRFTVDFTAPSSAVDLRIYFKQSPPNSGEGQVFVDDVSVVQWDGKVSDAKAGFTLPTPNNHGFLRFTGASGSALDVTLTHRAYTVP